VAQSRRYVKQQKLGEGTYSSVFRGSDCLTGEVVAMKFVRMDLEEDGIPSSSLREISILTRLKHPNILDLKTVVREGQNLFLVLEFMDFDVKRWLNSGARQCPVDLLRSYSYQLLCGCCFLHSHSVIHHNLQSSHLLINRNGLLKICDFGSIILIEHPLSIPERRMTVVSNLAPELLIDPPITNFAIDIWSCGCIIAELACGRPLFCGDCPVDQLLKICQTRGTPTEEEWPEFYKRMPPEMQFPREQPSPLSELFPMAEPDLVDLLEKLLDVNPRTRISAEDALQHRYFKPLPEVLVNMCFPFIDNEEQLAVQKSAE
jgi:serine/threonine protein kinase